MKKTWKRNIDEPYKVRVVTGRLVDLSPNERLDICDDIAKTAVVEMVSSIFTKLRMIDGAADDFAFTTGLALDKVMISTLRLLDDYDQLSENHVAAYRILMEKMPLQFEAVISLLKVRPCSK